VDAESSVIGGGYENFVRGRYSVIPGGYRNGIQSDHSVALGTDVLIYAPHSGSFLFADYQSSTPFLSVSSNEFAVRATGGVRLVTGIDPESPWGAPTAGVRLASGGSSWMNLSDRNSKTNCVPVDGRQILEKVAALPIATWNYKSQDKSIRHIGPMAQDFHAAFRVGEDDKHITSVDADGVALAAIQGLNEKLEEQLKAKDARIDTLEHTVAELKKIVERLTAVRDERGRR
jgi:hypothetical protein